MGSEKRPLTWQVDSAAANNVIDETSMLEHFPEVCIQKIPEGIGFQSADGSQIHMVGFFSSIFWFGGKKMVDDIYVCRGVTKTRLIGSTLLKRFSSWGIENKAGLFKADDIEIPLVQSVGNAPRISEVRLKKNITIPAKSYCFVRGELPYKYNPTEFVFHPNFKIFQRKQVALPVCLVANDVLDGSVMIKITNPNVESKELGRDTKLGKVMANLNEYTLSSGTVQELKGIKNINSNTLDKDEMENVLKQHKELYKLYIKSAVNLTSSEKVKLLRLLYKYKDVFSRDDNDIGTAKIIKHKIIPKSKEVVYRRQYRHTEEQHRRIDEEVDNLLKAGIIKESMSPFNSPVLLVPKKEPGKWRFCLDCRYINDLTEDQYFPIPLIEETIDCLSGATVFSALDMTSGYHQVLLDEETSDMCAFSTRKGHYQYTRMPMGLRNSGTTFQKMVSLLMTGMLHTEVLAYLDDCILFGSSNEQHFKTLEEVLERFKQAGLKLKPRKCQLFKNEILYLGFLIDERGVRPNPEATRKIKELPEPKSVLEVQRFLGKVNYYRKFIPKLAHIGHPLYELTKKASRAKFTWNSEHQAAFEQLKSILCSNQVMGHPRVDKQFIVDVDASDFALGVELSQLDKSGNERPIYYGSRRLEKTERNYSATARETLAAVFGCELFSQYLQGKKFILRTDHNPLVWLRNMKNPKRPYIGWLMRLEQFNYEIQYRPGKLHINADYNSRLPDLYEDNGISVATQTSEQLDPVHHVAQKVCSNIPSETIRKFSKSEEQQVARQPLLKMEKSVSAKIPPPKVQQVAQGCNVREALSDQRGHEEKIKDVIPQQCMAQQQEMDSDIGPILKRLKDPNLNEDLGDLTEEGKILWRDRKKLFIKDGVLFRKYSVKAGLTPINQVVLPKPLRNMMLESLHDSVLSGHFGVQRTMGRVKLRYYWPGYLNDTEEWCRTCLICQKRKSPQSKNITPLQNLDVGQGPFEQIALDILKLPVTPRGNQYVLLIEDYFTKWVEAFPLERTAAPSVAQCVLNGWIARFGCPFTILSDQGSEFRSKLFKSLTTMLQIRKLRTSAYHPRTDGMVERSNRTLIDVLSKFAEKVPDWDLRLPLVMFAIRTAEHTTTKFSPFFLTYGKEACIPWDIVYGSPCEPLPQEEWADARRKEMEEVFRLVKQHTSKAQHHQKQYYDKNIKGKLDSFKVGEYVMLCDPTCRVKEGKLNSPWSGPHEIIDKISEALYKLKVKDNEVFYNVERLKKYYPRKPLEHSGNGELSFVSDDEEEENNNEELDEPINNNGQPADEEPANPNEVSIQGNPPVTNNREPLMREGGKYWCNVDPANVLAEGETRRK